MLISTRLGKSIEKKHSRKKQVLICTFSHQLCCSFCGWTTATNDSIIGNSAWVPEFFGIFFFVADFVESDVSKKEMTDRDHGWMKNGLFLPCVWSFALIFLCRNGDKIWRREDINENWRWCSSLLYGSCTATPFHWSTPWERLLATHRIVLQLRKRKIATLSNVSMALFDSHSNFDHLDQYDDVVDNK